MLIKAREIQQIVKQHLCIEKQKVYTDVEGWCKIQTSLARSINELMKCTGSNPTEEGERLLAILMGYTLAVRNAKNITDTLQQAEKVLPCIDNKLLKCKLAIFCYGECFNKELEVMVHTLMEELRDSENEKELHCLKELMMSYELREL